MPLKKLDVALNTSKGFIVVLWTCFKRCVNVLQDEED